MAVLPEPPLGATTVTTRPVVPGSLSATDTPRRRSAVVSDARSNAARSSGAEAVDDVAHAGAQCRLIELRSRVGDKHDADLGAGFVDPVGDGESGCHRVIRSYGHDSRIIAGQIDDGVNRVGGEVPLPPLHLAVEFVPEGATHSLFERRAPAHECDHR